MNKLEKLRTLLLPFLISISLPVWAMERPEVERISPPGGTIAGGLVQMNGRNFITGDGQDLYVSIIDRHNFQLTQSAGGDNERLYVEIPDTMSPGPITMRIMRRAHDGTVAQSDPIPYSISSPPEIHGVSPSQGPQGAIVTLSGNGFGTQQNSSYVLFVGELKNEFRGSARAAVLSWSDAKIQMMVPSDLADGPCDIRLVKMGPDTKGVLTDAGDESRFTVIRLPF